MANNDSNFISECSFQVIKDMQYIDFCLKLLVIKFSNKKRSEFLLK